MKDNAKQLDIFIALSETLTGYPEFKLRGTGMVESYYNTTMDIVGKEMMNQLLDTFASIRHIEEEQELNRAFRAKILGDEKLGPIARNVIKLWFVGTWYQLPYNWTQKFGINENDKTFVVSPNAYIEGLLWPTIGAHPMGAKAPGYGTWSAPPDIPAV